MSKAVSRDLRETSVVLFAAGGVCLSFWSRVPVLDGQFDFIQASIWGIFVHFIAEGIRYSFIFQIFIVTLFNQSGEFIACKSGIWEGDDFLALDNKSIKLRVQFPGNISKIYLHIYNSYIHHFQYSHFEWRGSFLSTVLSLRRVTLKFNFFSTKIKIYSV